MGQESKYFGAPTFSPRELKLLRATHRYTVMGERYLRWRYRDRVHFGRDCRVDPSSVMVSGLGTVELGDEVIIERGAHQVVFHLAEHSRVVLGRGTWFVTFDDNTIFSTKPGAEIRLGQRCWLSGGIFGATKKITVGDHTLIGWGCMILDSNLHRMDNDAPDPESKPVTIGSHVWMPSFITVLPGVTIGDHCVIGTGSLVTEDIPDHSFAAGRPARVIRKIGDRDRVE